jgi:copper chaperone CopZ
MANLSYCASRLESAANDIERAGKEAKNYEEKVLKNPGDSSSSRSVENAKSNLKRAQQQFESAKRDLERELENLSSNMEKYSD